MRSLTAALARQIVVAAALSALLIAAVTSQRSDDHRALAASQSADAPIFTRAIVTAAAPPLAQSAPIGKAPIVTRASAAHSACAAPCTRIAAAQGRPRPVADPTPEPVNLASIAPAAQTDPPPPSLKKRLFAPVGFIRDNVARLIERL
jgi:hypothetical protein